MGFPRGNTRTLACLLLWAVVWVSACSDDGTQTTDDTPDTGSSADVGDSEDAGSPDMAVTPDAGTDSGTACDSDSVGPTVTVTPASPVVLPFDQTSLSLELTFDEPVTGLEGSILSSGGTTLGVSGSGDSYLILVEGLQSGESYELLSAASGIRDECGNPMAEAIRIEITVEEDPCSGDEVGPTVSVGPSNPIMVPPMTTFVDVTFSFSEEVEGLNPGVLTVDNGASIAAVTPSGLDYLVRVDGLSEGLTNLTLSATVQDTCGNAIGSETNVVIDVEPDDTVPPMVMSTNPANLATAVAIDSTIEINFTEPVEPTSGMVLTEIAGVDVPVSPAFSNGDQTLVLTPLASLAYGATVDVTVSGFRDVSTQMNSMASPYAFSFEVEPDPCLGIPPASALQNTTSLALLERVSGEARVTLSLSSAFAVTESMVSVTATNGGAGVLRAGSFTGGPTDYEFVLDGAAEGDEYDVVVANGVSADGCTNLTGGTVGISIVVVPDERTDCTELSQLPLHHVAADVCGQSSNGTPQNAEATGFTVETVGDAFSIGSIYDSTGNPDYDFFSFSVLEDATTITSVRVTFLYGCSYTGSGVPGGSPEIALYPGTSTTALGTFTGEVDNAVVNGSGFSGYGTATFDLNGAAGTNDYLLRMDDVAGTDWCMDAMLFVEVVARRPVACAGTAPFLELAPSGGIQDVFLNTNSGVASVEFATDFGSLTESELALTATNGGAGTIVPGSLVESNGVYRFELSGASVGDTYDVSVADVSTTCTAFTGGTFPIEITNNFTSPGPCPLPGGLANHHVGVDLCDQRTNGTLATSEATGFTLTNPGDTFSVAGIYDSDGLGGSDNDFYSFEVAEDGLSVTELDVKIAYGCTFTGTGTPGPNAPIVEIRDSTGATIASLSGQSNYDQINGTGSYGIGLGRAELVGSAGTNTYHIWIDDDVGANWCMDYVIYVETIDNSLPIVCQNSPSTVSLDTSVESVYVDSSSGSLEIVFNGDYQLEQSDLTLVAVSGAGTLVPGSLSGGGDTYRVDVTGIALGDSYELQIAAKTDLCGTSFAGGTIAYTTTSIPSDGVACPLPAPLSKHYTHVDLCDEGTNGTVATAASTGFTLINAGDAFSISGIYDSDTINGSDNDIYSFNVNATGVSTYLIKVDILYGCTFSGAGTLPTTTTPEVTLLGSSGTGLASFNAEDTYASVSGSGFSGFGTNVFTIPPAELPTGINALYLRLDDGVGTNWCMDYMVYVTLTEVN